MFRIIITICVMAVIWAGNWFWGYRANLAATIAWLDGAQSTYGAPSQSGFPNRYDVTLPDVTISDIRFQADFIQVLRVVYKDDHRIIILPNAFSIFGQEIQGQGIRASVVQDGPNFPRLVVEGKDLTLPRGLTTTRGQISVMSNVGENQFAAYVWLENAALDGTPLAPEIKLTIKFELPSGAPAIELGALVAALRQVREMQITTETAQDGPVKFDIDWPISADFNAPLTPDIRALLDWTTEFTR